MQAAASLSPLSGPVRYNLGALLRRMGRAEQAVIELEAAAALLPGDPQVAAELQAARESAAGPSSGEAWRNISP